MENKQVSDPFRLFFRYLCTSIVKKNQAFFITCLWCCHNVMGSKCIERHAGEAMKKHIKSPSIRMDNRETSIRTRTMTLVALVGSIALGMTLFGTFAAFAAGVKETPT